MAIFALFGDRSVSVPMVQRYATAIVNVVETEELPFRGKDAKEKSALLIWGLAYHEAGIDLEAIEFCKFKPIKGIDQDDGKSIGITQLYEGASWRGHTRAEICGNVELQFRLGFRYLTEQVRKCGSIERALTGYNANECRASVYSGAVTHQYRKASESVAFLLQPGKGVTDEVFQVRQGRGTRVDGNRLLVVRDQEIR